jgi:peptide/nickel transport system permease protein
MLAFISKRLLFVLFSLVGATIFVFALSRMAGDPTLLYVKPGGYGTTEAQLDAIRAKLGLDKPLIIQYILWVGNLLKGDLGNTLLAEQPVSKVIGEKIGATFQLGFSGWLFGLVLGVPLGVLSAVKRAGVWDYIARGFALFGQALPPFWIGIMGVFVFAVLLGWLPAAFRSPPGEPGFHITHFILPTITVGWASAAAYTRLTRSSMLEVLNSEYVKFARAKGVGTQTIIWKHAFRNALIPTLTLSALVLAGLLNGAVVAEVIFAWPGIGRIALIEAVNNNDFPLLTGAVLIFTIIYLIMNFIADILYAVIDPRIRYD